MSFSKKSYCKVFTLFKFLCIESTSIWPWNKPFYSPDSYWFLRDALWKMLLSWREHWRPQRSKPLRNQTPPCKVLFLLNFQSVGTSDCFLEAQWWKGSSFPFSPGVGLMSLTVKAVHLSLARMCSHLSGGTARGGSLTRALKFLTPFPPLRFHDCDFASCLWALLSHPASRTASKMYQRLQRQTGWSFLYHLMSLWEN